MNTTTRSQVNSNLPLSTECSAVSAQGALSRPLNFQLQERLPAILPLLLRDRRSAGEGRGEGPVFARSIHDEGRAEKFHLVGSVRSRAQRFNYFTHLTHLTVLAAALVVLPSITLATDDDSDSTSNSNRLNRVTVSARFGFNFSAKFKGLASLPQPIASRSTSRGDRYNYDDGYVLTDISGNQGNQTWYWGYDNSASQISGNTILLSRTTVNGGTADQTIDSDPTFGAEILFRRQLYACNKFRFGVEAAANYQNMTLKGANSGLASVSKTTDAYPYTSGTTPPTASSGSPYQGSYEGPGFVIGDSPTSSSTTTANSATLSGNQRLDADIFGFRVGPYVDYQLCDHWDISLSGGLAVGLLSPTVTWSETVTLSTGDTASVAGSGDDFHTLLGGYVAGTLTYQVNERWSLAAGVQYQALQRYEHSFAGRGVEIDLRNSIYLTIGVGYSF
jgi:hypothetical protein